ncbi:MAG: hypothetical protein FWC16_04185 [Defluviitaleaceae bacterium]|nr:hypothetical protein [Defluviitaleaceae bacterium]MCL2273994.1 hypothetical protein [Defluviitaleaceae bacterium]MCL2274105.1 hypothetical protein [Defluviitaleaceae bacterium]
MQWYEVKSGQRKSQKSEVIYITRQVQNESKIISTEINGELTPNYETIKIPWFTVGILAFLCVASLVTGVIYWYTAYFNPDDYYTPTMLAVATPAPVPTAENTAPPINGETTNDAYYTPPYETQVYVPRPQMDPLPEFVALWEEYDNPYIVGRLLIADMDMLVLQYETNDFGASPYGWVFLDHQVDLLIGEEHNMVIHVSADSPVRDALQAYLEYDFFLMFPTIQFSTMYGNFDWEIFSFYVAPDVFPFKKINHPSDAAFGDAVEQFTMASLYNTRLDVMQYDQILTITAPTANPALHYVLQARMLRKITS